MPTAVAKRLYPKDRLFRSATYPYLVGPEDRNPLIPSPLEKRPPILAVVVGINDYASQDYENLNGAVGDADAFEAFLKFRLQVPESNILSLRDEAASRDAIISSFGWFRDDPRYRRNEVAMVFYYAGHGAQSQKPDEWDDWVTPTGNIEMLCPSDIGVLINPNNPQVDQEEAEVVQGIPDRTISVLLNEVSNVKGNNIILTHGSREATLSKNLRASFHASYVLLAACGREQFALEDRKSRRGLFTYTLLKALDREDFDTLTYISLVHKIKIPARQTPHCEGEGIYWRLFNNRVSGADGSFILTKRVKNGGPITLEAGSAQGITVGSRFTAHETNLIETPIMPNPPSRNLCENIRPPLQFYSKLKQRAAVRHIFIYSADHQWLESVFPPEVRTELSATFVDDVKSCDLELSVEGGIVHFDRHNNLVTPLLVGVDEVDTIRAVVKASLHFYYHLTRSAPATFKNVWMELQELKSEPNEEFGENLLEEEPAEIVVDENAQLGMTIYNESSLTLYPYLFYFDPTELTIFNWYMPPFGADAPLPPNSKLAIGYGDGGAIPWQFVIPDGESKDLGFFRLFLSTRPAYFESILQEMSTVLQW
ncbi:hypothetical protein CPB84DRAFT_1817961 [Gymnopilus junonius]|uniref:Peptidase C14 caspase domain-containing protein n=1 Tax=Gymnopilus junonius TaxID=109634 RepID=A0A9P5TGZ1_GYMJU|nr:hypothetical protein CPB84DRAFT_1817961 [Gymnopilus junonius]